ncbi:hypothetical protein evm_005808 [Chilo suppressalis]|nr:hypothetical protein evm_005808 [Chilo suppressalis]
MRTLLICTKPQEIRGMSFYQLFENSKTLECPQAAETAVLPGSETAIVLGVIIGVFAAFPLVFVIVLLWRRGYFAKCRKKMSSDQDSDEEHAAL